MKTCEEFRNDVLFWVSQTLGLKRPKMAQGILWKGFLVRAQTLSGKRVREIPLRN